MTAQSRRVVVWNDTCLGVDAGDDAADWLAATLGEPLRLVRIDPSVPRLASTQFAGPGPHPVSFADGYPVLMISRESLAELNRRLPVAIPMARFRPNVVIEGVAAHAEDAMTRFRFGPGGAARRQALHALRDHDDRPATAARATRTRSRCARSKTYRHDHALKGVIFGQNCVIEAGVGERLAVGAELTID